MNRGYMLDDYVKENVENQAAFEEADSYLVGLQTRLKSTKSLTEVMIEVGKFLDKYAVNDEVKKELLNICNSFDENTTVIKARTELENYLSKYLEEKEDAYHKSDEKVDEVKEEVIDDANRDLDTVGVELVGDKEAAMDELKTSDDVYRFKENVDNAYDYFAERNKVVDTADAPNIEVSLDTVSEIVDSPKDNIVLDTALANQNAMLSTNPNVVEAKEDGSVEMILDSNTTDAINFTAMMTTALVASDKNLDMKFIKGKNDTTTFKVIYGNFPLVNHPENRLDNLLISQIQQEANTYNASIDYMKTLERNSPVLETALNIIDDNVLGKQGAFQMAVNNNSKQPELLFAMDENYENVLEAFSNNGAVINRTAQGNGIATISEEQKGNQLFVLTNTSEQLTIEKNNANVASLAQSYQYVKKNDIHETANVTHALLSVIAIAEIVFAVFYFMILLFF